MNAKKDQFVLESETVSLDLAIIARDKKECEVLKLLRADLIESGQFDEPKKNEFDFASAATLIMYLESLEALLDTHNESQIVH